MDKYRKAKEALLILKKCPVYQDASFLSILPDEMIDVSQIENIDELIGNLEKLEGIKRIIKDPDRNGDGIETNAFTIMASRLLINDNVVAIDFGNRKYTIAEQCDRYIELLDELIEIVTLVDDGPKILW